MKTLKTIQSKLREASNPEKAIILQRFFKTGKGEYGEGDKFLGIQIPLLRALVKEFPVITIEESFELLQSVYHEERMLGLLFFLRLFQKGDEKTKKKIFDLYLKNTSQINNWDLVDASAPHIVGAWLWDKERKVLYKLVKSKSLWERRIAIISTQHFIGKKDFAETLSISKILLNDKADLIHKAVGWMLREIGNRDLETEETFLKEHYKQMPRTMLRYAIEKFPEKRRREFLEGKV